MDGQASKRELDLIASGSFRISGEAYKLVTFLNQALKDENLIFGLCKGEGGRLSLNIYRANAKSHVERTTETSPAQVSI